MKIKSVWLRRSATAATAETERDLDASGVDRQRGRTGPTTNGEAPINISILPDRNELAMRSSRHTAMVSWRLDFSMSIICRGRSSRELV